MSNITKETVQSFRSDFADAMKKLEKKYGVTVSIGNIKYNANNFRTQLEAKAIDKKTGKATVDPRMEFAARIALKKVGTIDFASIEKGVIGKQFKLSTGETATVVNFNPRKPKYCFAIEINGKGYNCPATMLIKAL